MAFDPVVVAPEHIHPARIAEFIKEFEDIRVYLFDIRKTSVFPQFIAVTQLYIGKPPLEVIAQGRFIDGLIVEKTVAPCAVASVSVAE